MFAYQMVPKQELQQDICHVKPSAFWPRRGGCQGFCAGAGRAGVAAVATADGQQRPGSEGGGLGRKTCP